MKVNGKHVEGIGIAFDGCHKIYVCKNSKEVQEARGFGYEIYRLSELQKIYENSCPFHFISTFDLTEYYVQQGEEAVFEEESMKKYHVRLYYHTSVEVEVSAPDRLAAIEKAREDASMPNYEEELIEGLEEDDSPDVYVWNDQLKDYQAL